MGNVMAVIADIDDKTEMPFASLKSLNLSQNLLR